MTKIIIIDCGIGNRASIRNMLKQIGYDSLISDNPQQILSADILILPGIGSFDAFMTALTEKNLIAILNEAVLYKKIPVLGICLGMQILFEKSEEGELSGLNWISGEVCSLRNLFKSEDEVKLPNIGWQKVNLTNDFFIPKDNQYYFVHSYYCQPRDTESIIGKININGRQIAVAVKKDNIYGVQFHPEKSHRYGLDFFKEFLQHVS